MFFIEWWNALSIAGQIFACIAIPSTFVLLVQTVMMLVGFAGDSSADGGDSDVPDGDELEGVFGDNDTPDAQDVTGLDGLRIFTIRGIIAFFVVFGWVGIVMDGSGVGLPITLLVSAVCGFAMMILLAYLTRLAMKLRSDGTADNKNALGVAGRVHLTVPAERSGQGKVHIMLQGAYAERDAVTDEEAPIPTGSEIVVIGVSGKTTLVVKRK
ncbi:MAG: hypothetical protein E7675_06660 [Ruminococcaceae bacterium]|nr:hypothetical protein [Oscillospiraceae bacterium]